FSGWFDQPIGGLRVYEISQGTIGDLTLYARWTAKQYTITYQTNGGTILADQTVTYNQNFTLGTTSKTGYTFLGWTLEGDDFVAGIWNIDSNITLVAKYEVINFTISYIDEFTQPHTNPTSYNIETPSFTLVSPSIKTGYQFDGWYD